MSHNRNALMRALTPTQRAGICRLDESGESGHALAKRFGVSKTTIHNTLVFLPHTVRRMEERGIPKDEACDTRRTRRRVS